jgi:hypothetical protein
MIKELANQTNDNFVNRKNNQSTFDESTDKYWDELEYQ